MCLSTLNGMIWLYFTNVSSGYIFIRETLQSHLVARGRVLRYPRSAFP